VIPGGLASYERWCSDRNGKATRNATELKLEAVWGQSDPHRIGVPDAKADRGGTDNRR
jgi:hypothetical protein